MGLFSRKKIKESSADSLLLLRDRRSAASGLGELGNSAMWACVMQLARLYATLPWSAYSKDSSGNRRDSSLPLRNLLATPNRWMTSYEFRFVMALNYELTGEAYAIVERTTRGVPAYMVPVPTGSVVARVNDNGDLIYSINGKNYSKDRILAIRNTPSGITSVLSPAQYAHSDVEFEEKCQAMQTEYFDGASVIGNLIKVPSNLTPEQKAQIKSGFDTTNGFRNIVVDNRVDVVPIQVNSADITKLVDAQKWSARTVASRFGVPGFFVGLTEGAYNNLEDQNIYFLTYCLNPRLRAWEEALTAALCSGSDYIEFNREGLLQGNSSAKISYYNAALNNGWMNRNEIRAKENLPNLGKDGEVFFMQSAMKTVDQIISGESGGDGGFNPWSAPQENVQEQPKVEKEKPAPKMTIEEKKERDRLFVEEATKQALTARKKLELEISRQLRQALDTFKGHLDAGMGPQTALETFSQELDAIGSEHHSAYFDIYRTVAEKLRPVITKQVTTGGVVSDDSIDAFINTYVDGLTGRLSGTIYKRMEKVQTEEDFEEEADKLRSSLPFNESTEEVHRSSNALSLFMFTALGLTVYHIVSDPDCCTFCETLDGKVASVNGYVLNKGEDMPDGVGGVRRIDKNYRHPPFHTFCRCHVAPGE